MSVDLSQSRSLAAALEQFSKTAGPAVPSINDFSEAMVQMAMEMQKKAVRVPILGGRGAATTLKETLEQAVRGGARRGAQRGLQEGVEQGGRTYATRQGRQVPHGASGVWAVNRPQGRRGATPGPAPTPGPGAPPPPPPPGAAQGRDPIMEGIRWAGQNEPPPHMRPAAAEPQGWTDYLFGMGEGAADMVERGRNLYRRFGEAAGRAPAGMIPEERLLVEQARRAELAKELATMQHLGAGAGGMLLLDYLFGGGGGGGQPPVVYKM